MNDWTSKSDQSKRYKPIRLSVPPGFQNLIRLISHEVIREQPKDNVKFIAEFLQDVLAIREKTGYDPVIQGELIELVQSQYAEITRERMNEARKRPPPTDTAAGSGDYDPVTKRESKERVETILDDVMDEVAKTTNQEEEVPKEAEPATSEPVAMEEQDTTEDQPGTTSEPAEETEDQPDEATEPMVVSPEVPTEETSEKTEVPNETLAEATEAPAEATEALAEATEAPAEATEAPAEATEAPAEVTEVPSGSTETQADGTDEPAEPSEETPAE